MSPPVGENRSMDNKRLSQAHYDLLQALVDLQRSDTHLVSTEAVGQRLLEIYKIRGGPYSWMAYAPWHGTDPGAQDLRDAGLVEFDPGMASFRAYDQPAPTARAYSLGINDEGRAALQEHANGTELGDG